jgi:hypothetical protein
MSYSLRPTELLSIKVLLHPVVPQKHLNVFPESMQMKLFGESFMGLYSCRLELDRAAGVLKRGRLSMSSGPHRNMLFRLAL